jgi:hypothetical protein
MLHISKGVILSYPSILKHATNVFDNFVIVSEHDLDKQLQAALQ